MKIDFPGELNSFEELQETAKQMGKIYVVFLTSLGPKRLHLVCWSAASPAFISCGIIHNLQVNGRNFVDLPRERFEFYKSEGDRFFSNYLSAWGCLQLQSQNQKEEA